MKPASPNDLGLELSLVPPYSEALIREARQEIRMVCDALPRLCKNGFYGTRSILNDEEFALSRGGMDSDESAHEFLRARLWLSFFRPDSVARWSRTDSYGMKHTVERFFRRQFPEENAYVSNGIFLAAAVREGFKLKLSRWEGPNAFLRMRIAESTDHLDRAFHGVDPFQIPQDVQLRGRAS